MNSIQQRVQQRVPFLSGGFRKGEAPAASHVEPSFASDGLHDHQRRKV